MAKRFQKTILKVGRYQSPDGAVEVTPERLKHWAKQHKRLSKAKQVVPISWDHGPPEDSIPMSSDEFSSRRKRRSAANTIGHLKDFKVADDGKSAEITLDIHRKSAIQSAKDNSVFVSPVIFPEWQDGRGRKYDDVITHVDFVNHPVDNSQSPFTPVQEGTLACALRMSLTSLDEQEEEPQFETFALSLEDNPRRLANDDGDDDDDDDEEEEDEDDFDLDFEDDDFEDDDDDTDIFEEDEPEDDVLDELNEEDDEDVDSVDDVDELFDDEGDDEIDSLFADEDSDDDADIFEEGTEEDSALEDDDAFAEEGGNGDFDSEEPEPAIDETVDDDTFDIEDEDAPDPEEATDPFARNVGEQVIEDLFEAGIAPPEGVDPEKNPTDFLRQLCASLRQKKMDEEANEDKPDTGELNLDEEEEEVTVAQPELAALSLEQKRARKRLDATHHFAERQFRLSLVERLNRLVQDGRATRKEAKNKLNEVKAVRLSLNDDGDPETSPVEQWIKHREELPKKSVWAGTGQSLKDATAMSRPVHAKGNELTEEDVKSHVEETRKKYPGMFKTA